MTAKAKKKAGAGRTANKKTSEKATAPLPASNKKAAKGVAAPTTPAPKTNRASTKRTAAGPAYMIGTLAIYDDNRPLPKSKLSAKDLEEFTHLLLVKRRELVGDMGNLAGEALGRNRQDASGDLSAMPIHMADIGSDNWEQEFTLGLLDNERKVLREIDDALARIEAGTYGVCLATHKPIPKARLRAKPWAKYCIEYAKLLEAGRVPP